MMQKKIKPKSANLKLDVYEPPSVDVLEFSIEKGFALSGGEAERWDEIPGGGSF